MVEIPARRSILDVLEAMAGFVGIADPSVAAAMKLSNFNVRNSAAFTRPADSTAYSVGDLVANSTTAGLVLPLEVSVARFNGGSGCIIGAKLRKTDSSLTNAYFRVHLFRSAPTVITNGDNGAFAVNNAAGYIGYIDMVMDVSLTDGAIGVGSAGPGPFRVFETASNSKVLYALIEAKAAYTPASGETFTLVLEVEQN